MTQKKEKSRIIYSHWLVTVGTLELLSGVSLVLAQDVGSENDVSWLVDTVNVSESGSDGEARRDLGKSAVDLPDVLGLGVERGVIDTSVVNTVLLTTGDTDLHLEPDWISASILQKVVFVLTTNLGHSLKVLHTGSNVLLVALL